MGAATLLGLSLAPLFAAAATFNIRDFGARGDGVATDTVAIQKAVDAAAAQGGGTVYLPAGRYLSGTVHFKSRVTLHLDNGAVLLASTDNAAFAACETLPFESVSDKETTYFRYALITAENAENIAITGQGVIDGNRTKRGGPKTIALKLCRNVSIRGVTVANAPNYAISLWGSDFVDIDGVHIVNGYADGIDPDSSRYVRIANSYIDTWDDAICPKGSPSMGMDRIRATEHLTVTNCVLRTSCSNIKFGTESSGDLRDVTISNVTMLPRASGRPPIAGIALESVDGAHIDGVTVTNVTMNGVTAPIFLRLGNRGRGLQPPVPGTLENVIVSNVIVRGARGTSSITGLPEARIRRVLLSNIQIDAEGGAGAEGAPSSLEVVPEHPAKYPEATMFGTLPAWGLYVRHTDGLTLTHADFRRKAPDARVAVVVDDGSELEIDGFRAPAPWPAIWLNDVRDALVRAAAGSPSLVRATGSRNSGLRLDLR
jgi:polygalacturonase